MQVVPIAFPILFLALLGSVQANNGQWTEECLDQAYDACPPGQGLAKDKTRAANTWGCMCNKWMGSGKASTCFEACKAYDDDDDNDDAYCTTACQLGAFKNRRGKTTSCKEVVRC